MFDSLLPAELALDEEPFNDDELDLWVKPVENSNCVDLGLVQRVLRWLVTDDSSAEWAMRKLAEVDAEEKKLKADRDAWIVRIYDWFDRRSAVLAPRRAFFENHLERYQAERRAADPKAKTLYLPSGEVRSTARAARVKVENDATFVKWAIDHAPEVLETVHKVIVRNLKQRFVPCATEGLVADTMSGEMVAVPGLDVEPAGTSYKAVPS